MNHELYPRPTIEVAAYLPQHRPIEKTQHGGEIYSAIELNRAVNFTTMLRFFYRTVLWEIGGDLNGRPWIQLMIHY